MLFRQMIFSALLIGIVSGLLHSAIQMLDVTAIIFEAETYETTEATPMPSHDHTHETWAPEEGTERTIYTVIANIFAGMGFATILLALMNQLQQQGLTDVNMSKGICWGLAGFIVFFAAPGLGLTPEIPGMQTASLEARQVWWVITVLATATGLAVLAFAPFKFKFLGIVCLLLPHLIGAPHINGAEFTHPDPSAVEALLALHQKFIWATGLSNLIFWLVLGMACAWVIKRSTTHSFSNG